MGGNGGSFPPNVLLTVSTGISSSGCRFTLTENHFVLGKENYVQQPHISPQLSLLYMRTEAMKATVIGN